MYNLFIINILTKKKFHLFFNILFFMPVWVRVFSAYKCKYFSPLPHSSLPVTPESPASLPLSSVLLHREIWSSVVI